VISISAIFRTRWTNLDSDNLLPLENYGELNKDEHVIFCSGTMCILFSEIYKRGLQSAGTWHFLYMQPTTSPQLDF